MPNLKKTTSKLLLALSLGMAAVVVPTQVMAGNATYKIHLDGYNFLPYLKGEAKSGPRDSFFAFVDDGSLGAMRHKAYKFNFSTQNHSGFDAWLLGQDKRKAPMVIDILADPFEMTPEDSSYYDNWINRRMFLLSPMTARVGEFMATFKEFPPRQDPTSFTTKN